jgi:hypothetical protein
MGEQMAQKSILDLTRTAEIFVRSLPQFGGWPLIVVVIFGSITIITILATAGWSGSSSRDCHLSFFDNDPSAL